MHLGRSLAGLALLAGPAFAQWNPPAGQWGKQVASDLRCMTWNVQDGICSTNSKVEGANNWCALAHIVAAFQPDVLLLQECGDNSGNGTGSSIDTVAQLSTTLSYFLHGGLDSFHGFLPITSFVQQYAPGYDLPYVFVNTVNDGFNRNVILSRYPFQDLNGDGLATRGDIPTVTASLWAPGGNGGIRGFMFAEVDLPASYPGNLVVGCAHLKAGSQPADHTQRIVAAQNVSYVLRYWWNGNGGTLPDPLGTIADNPPATSVLDASTPFVIGGDWNEDEFTNGTKGPAEWLSMALTTGGTSDGTDHDGTDATFDHALDYFTGNDDTHSSGAKYDYLLWQDSIVSQRLALVFESSTLPSGAMPPELATYAVPALASLTASDHRPVIVDLVYPVVDCNGNGIADDLDLQGGSSTDYNADGVPDECECFAQDYCSSLPNSTGQVTGIVDSGSRSIAANSFVLEAFDGPPNANGMFLASRNTQQIPFGNGTLCVASPIQRLGLVQLDAFGAGQRALDFSALPAGLVIHGGETWHFQFWHRDTAAGGANVNTSHGRRVAFCP
jgi:endonuclease/exonuclease/phosphatase family metal-dependent hydrolase